MLRVALLTPVTAFAVTVDLVVAAATVASPVVVTRVLDVIFSTTTRHENPVCTHLSRRAFEPLNDTVVFLVCAEYLAMTCGAANFRLRLTVTAFAYVL